jgi:hypothetical protein
MFKWALLVLVLAIIVFMNVSQETEETTQLQTGELEDLEALALEEHKGDWVENGGYRVFGVRRTRGVF